MEHGSIPINTKWEERKEWPYSGIDRPTICNMSYMTSKTPLSTQSWKYRDNYFKNTGEYKVGSLTNNHTHLFKYKGKYYLSYYAMYLQDYFGTNGGFRNVDIEEMQVDEQSLEIKMGSATFAGVAQLATLHPFVVQQAETTAGTSGKVQFKPYGKAGNMVALGTSQQQCLMVRGADFRTRIPCRFEARVKGKGTIDVYVNSLKGKPAVSLLFNTNNWIDVSKIIDQKVDKAVQNIYFVYNGEDFLFDEWRFYY